MDVLLNGALSAGLTTLSPHMYSQSSILGSVPPLPRIPCSSRVDLYPNDLINAYGNIYGSAIARSNPGCKATMSLPHPPSLFDLFKVGSPAYRILLQNKKAALRPVALRFIINIIIFHCRKFSNTTLHKLHNVYVRNMKKCDVDLANGVEMLFWALTTDLDTMEVSHPKWLDLLSRLLYAESRLDLHTQDRLSQTLLDFIICGSTDSASANPWWTPEQFRDIVHKELGVCGASKPYDPS